jgi:hypothetical protein
MRGLSAGDGSGGDNRERRGSRTNGLARVAMWIAGLGAGGLILRRARRGRKSIDVGAVSPDWVAQRRGTPGDPFSH